MGNELSAVVPSLIQPVEFYISDLESYYHFVESLGSTRFLKVAKILKKDADLTEGFCVVKVFVLHDPSFSLRPFRDQLISVRDRLKTNAPNCAPFQKVIVTDKSGILIRQFGRQSLFDRMNTRPFLVDIERKWIAFQLLKALEQCLNVGNNPSDFTYFFDASRRQACYVAPERFKEPSQIPNTLGLLAEPSASASFLTHSMDIFSAGCVLVELFTDGGVPFRLIDLLRYKNKEFKADHILSKVFPTNAPERLKELITDMIQLDPKNRPSASQLLDKYYQVLFPQVFYEFYWPYASKTVAQIPALTYDQQIIKIRKDEKDLLSVIKRERERADDMHLLIISLITANVRAVKQLNSKLDTLKMLKAFAAVSDDQVKLERIVPYVIYSISDAFPRIRAESIKVLTKILASVEKLPMNDARIFPDYVLPKIVNVVNDISSLVRVTLAANISILAETAIRYLEYAHTHDIDVDPQVVQQQQAQHQLLHVRNKSNSPPAPGGTQHMYGYEQELTMRREMHHLQEGIQDMVVQLLIDTNKNVRRVILHSGVPKLCRFFGKQRASDVLLSHMITFLNDKSDWHLRWTFYRNCPSAAAYIGSHSTLILKPLLQQGLGDIEEMVVLETLNCLSSLSKLGLLKKPSVYELLSDATPFLAHPNCWLRAGAVSFVSCVAKSLNMADIHCKVMPMLNPYLKQPLIKLDQKGVVMRCLRDGVPRNVWECVISSNYMHQLMEFLQDKYLLRQLSPHTPPSFLQEESNLLMDNPYDGGTNSGGGGGITSEDPNVRNLHRKLMNLGLTDEIEPRLLAFSEVLKKMKKMKESVKEDVSPSDERPPIDRRGEINLRMINITKRHADLTFSLRRSATRDDRARFDPQQTNDEWEAMFGAPASRSEALDSVDEQADALSMNNNDNTDGSSTIPTNNNVPNVPKEKGDHRTESPASAAVTTKSPASVAGPPATEDDAIVTELSEAMAEIMGDSGTTILGKEDQSNVSHQPTSQPASSSSSLTAKNVISSGSLPSNQHQYQPQHQQQQQQGGGRKGTSIKPVIPPKPPGLSPPSSPNSSNRNKNQQVRVPPHENLVSDGSSLSSAIREMSSTANLIVNSGSQNNNNAIMTENRANSPVTVAKSASAVTIMPVPDHQSQSHVIEKKLIRTECGEALTELVEYKRQEYAKTPGSSLSNSAFSPTTLTGPPASFMPTGHLLAHMQEHRAAVSKLFAHPDHRLFATTSNDGCMKLWDASRFEGRGVANQSKVTYTVIGEKLKTGGFFPDGEHAFVGCESGRFQVLKIERMLSKKGSDRTKRPSPAIWEGSTDLHSDGGILNVHGWSEGTNNNGQVLLTVTHHGYLLGWDRRVNPNVSDWGGGPVYRLRNESEHGLITSSCMDNRNQHWVCLGTHLGYILTWDLRFRIPISQVEHPSRAVISNIWEGNIPGEPQRVWIAPSRNEELCLWDLETGTRMEGIWPQSGLPPLSYSQMGKVSTTAVVSRPNMQCIVTGNSEGAIRYWNMDKSKDSYALSIPYAPEKPWQARNREYDTSFVEGIEVRTERVLTPQQQNRGTNFSNYSNHPPNDIQVNTWHKDGISGLCWAYTGEQWFLISASRDGIVKVWK